MSTAERNYAHIEKEGLALVFAVKRYHQFLYGLKFKMVTDHKPLLGLFGQDKGESAQIAAVRMMELCNSPVTKNEVRIATRNGHQLSEVRRGERGMDTWPTKQL